MDRISPTSEEKDSAALEVVKLHQLVITDQHEENLTKPIEPEDALEEEEIEDAVACLITTNTDTIEDESWLNRKRSGYRAQKATISVKERVGKVETFSNYLISPLRKRYDVFFRSTMCVFKAIRCWLRKDLTKEAPKGWDKKREEIDERIQNLVRISKQEAVIEEIDTDERPEHKKEDEDNKPSIIRNKGRLDIRSRHQDACKALEYNILRRHENDNI